MWGGTTVAGRQGHRLCNLWLLLQLSPSQSCCSRFLHLLTCVPSDSVHTCAFGFNDMLMPEVELRSPARHVQGSAYMSRVSQPEQDNQSDAAGVSLINIATTGKGTLLYMHSTDSFCG